MNKIPFFFVLTLLLVCLSSQRYASANVIEPTHITDIHAPNLIHLGHGNYTRFGFEIYQAHLYVDETKLIKKFAIILDYARQIQKDVLIKATIEQLEKLGYPTKKTLEWKSHLDKIYPNINKGDQFAAIYSPTSGTTFIYGDKIVGNVLDQDFAEAFFGIWLSSKTSAPELRSKLLAKTCPEFIIQSLSCQ